VQTETGESKSTEDVVAEILQKMGTTIPAQLQKVVKELKKMAKCQGETVEGLTLIPCGPAVGLPLVAGSTAEGDLLDALPIRYLPSAGIGRTISSRRNARGSIQPNKFIALANPTVPVARGRFANLRGAIIESETVAATIFKVPPSVVKTVVKTAKEATLTNLKKLLKDSTHILISAHGQGDPSDDNVARLIFADVDLVLEAVPHALNELCARLVMLSTCENIVTFEKSPDEVMNFASAFLAAGTSCCVGTLWPVKDTAAALFTVKFFELHLNAAATQDPSEAAARPPEVNPAIALQRAQLWLRNLTAAGDREFFSRYPRLGKLFNDFIYLPGTRWEGDHPFGHPRYWAPYMAVGF
jgi:CHAT domain-containing protein